MNPERQGGESRGLAVCVGGNSWHSSLYTRVLMLTFDRLEQVIGVGVNHNKYTNRWLVIAGWVYGDIAASTGLVAQDGVTTNGQLGYGHGGGSRVGN